MSHVDAIAVLLESMKPTAIRGEQAERVSRGRQIQPIRIVRVPALAFLRVKNRV